MKFLTLRFGLGGMPVSEVTLSAKNRVDLKGSLNLLWRYRRFESILAPMAWVQTAVIVAILSCLCEFGPGIVKFSGVPTTKPAAAILTG